VHICTLALKFDHLKIENLLLLCLADPRWPSGRLYDLSVELIVRRLLALCLVC
jgi:hypothetical protein